MGNGIGLKKFEKRGENALFFGHRDTDAGSKKAGKMLVNKGDF